MGNKVLGRRSRSFYRGFSQRKVSYIKQKFETIAIDGKLDKNMFMNAYKLNSDTCDKFISELDFDEDSAIDEYQFICMVHSLCSLSIEELGAMFFKILTKGKNGINQAALLSFTQTCLNYNSYIERTDEKADAKKINANKFKKYDFNKDKVFSQEQFTKICLKDEDYKKWMFNMGFITKRQMEYQEDVYDLVDSDIGDQIERHDKQIKQSVSNIKQGIEHRLDDEQFQIKEEQGEQSARVDRPWVIATKNVKIQQQNAQPPNQSMKIDYVFGYRSFDCRNNVKFDNHGKVVYHQAAIGIVLNPAKNTQQFIIQHHDDITCLDVVEDTVVTGQTGAKPSIIMWRTKRQADSRDKKQDQLSEDSLPKQMIITDELKDGIICISLSDSKKRLAALCNDHNHRLVVYDLERVQNKRKNPTSTDRGIIATGVTTQSIPFDLKFDVSEKTLVLATIKDLLFISFEKGTLNSNRGQFGTFTVSAALCLQPLKSKGKQYMISGMGNGSVYFWQKQTCVKSVAGHQGSVSAICGRKDMSSFVSGDKAGNIIIWNQKFTKQKQIKVPTSNCPTSMVVALSCSRNKELLVGTKSSDIYMMKIGDGFEKANRIMSGHNDGYLWALSVDKDQNFIYTGGEDKRLIKWDYAKNKFERQALCAYPIRSMDLYDENKDAKGVQNDLLVVGYKNGVVECYNPNTLQNLKHSFTRIKNPDEEVLNLVKVNKDGTVCLACYQYPKFKIVALNLAQKQKGEMQMLAEIQVGSKVIAVDFDNNYQYIRVNTSKFQYLVYQMTIDAKKVTFTKLKDLSKAPLQRSKWVTHTLPFSPQTQGLLTQGVIEEDIVCCERDRRFRNVFLIGDKYSKIKLFNFPSKQNKIFNKFVGHSNEVTGIQFDKKFRQDKKGDKSDKYQFVFSIGGPQKSIIVWKYNGEYQKNEGYIAKLDAPSDDEDQQLNEQRKRKKKLLEEGDYKTEAVVGQRAMATKAFAGQIKLPSDYKQRYNARKDNQLPDQTISIKHVFGLSNRYIADHVRNQVKFVSRFQEIVFPTACLGVKMNVQTRKQQYYHSHREDIVSFAISPDRTIMATGQMAQKNTVQPRKKIVCIYVWDLNGNKILNKLDGFHSIAVVLLQFSPNGKLLYSCGNDAKNSFAIYDWISGAILYSGPTSGSKVNGISWKTNQQFVTCGMDHVKFWTGGKGQLGKTQQKFEAMFSCISSKRIYITGSGDGGIYNWIGNKSKPKIKAHTGKVHALTAYRDSIYSGADDGVILEWKAEANGQVRTSTKVFDTRQAKINIVFKESQIHQQQFGVLSIDFSDKRQLLVGTVGAAIIYKSGNNAQIIHQGHYKGELWGLTTRTSRDSGNYFITGGDDKSARLWDIQSRREVSRAYFKQKIRGLDWAPDGSRIVIADCKVKIHLFDSKQLKNRLCEYTGEPFEKNKKQKFPFVEQIKFSPDSKMIAYGCHGQSLIMETLLVDGSKLKLKKAFSQGSSALLHIDWSRDSSFIGINSQAYELLFFDSSSGKMISASATKDEEWATWTRKIGFQVKGIFQGVDYSDINTVCRDPAKSFLAVGYDDQSIRLFKYPAYVEKQVHRQYFGHSSHVTRVRFTSQYMVSLGGNDRTIIVWDIQRPNLSKSEISDGQDDGLDDLQEDVDLPNKAVTRKPKPIKQEQFYAVEDEGDQFMAIKPWLGAIKQPTYKFPKQTQHKPASQLTLEYVQGYRTKDCRQNLYYCDKQTIVFHAAAALIYHDIEKNTQKILTQHQDDILSIDYHKGTNQVITGQLGPKPFVCLFKDQKLVHTFIAPVKKGVLAVAFSPDGKKAACAGMDDDHHVALLDLVGKTIVRVVKGTKKVITKLIWISDSSFVSVGICHYKLWTVGGKDLTGKQSPKRYNMVSVAFDEQTKKVYTGASKGTIVVWSGTDAQKQEISLNKTTQQDTQTPVPAGIVDCLLIHGNLLLAGTKDGLLFVIEKKSKKIVNQIDMSEMYGYDVPSQCPGLRSIHILGNKILVGTLGSEIYQFQFNDFANTKKVFKGEPKNILKCHYSPNNTWTNQVWGLCTKGDYIFTCSDDATVRVWSISQRKLIRCASTNVMLSDQGEQAQLAKDKKTNDFDESAKSRAIGVSPDGKTVVVGAKDGTVRVYDFKGDILKLTKMFKHAKQWISDIKFGYNLLAIGSHDNAIYVYDFQDGNIKRKYAPLRKHSSYITHLDISRDNCFMQSTCGAYELLFWDLNTGKQMTAGASALRDQKWATWTCNLGWPVQGIYPKTTDGTFINAVDRSHTTVQNTLADKDYENPFLLAGGNDNGKVALYNYPCTIKSSQFVEGKGHSSHVTNVRWSEDDKYIISTGGQDQCVMYWRVTKRPGVIKQKKK